MSKPIYIGGCKYIYSTPKRIDKDDNWGEADHKAKTIKVKRGLPWIEAFPVIVHELIHVTNRAYQEHDGLQRMDEKDVDVLAKAVAGGLRQLGVVK